MISSQWLAQKVCTGPLGLHLWLTLAIGLALAPWNVLAGGKFRTDAEEERRRQTGENGRMLIGNWERTESEKKMSLALEKVAKEVGADNISAGRSSSAGSIHNS